MKLGSTLFLKGVIILIGAIFLALYAFGLTWIAIELADHYPAYLHYPVLIVFYGTAIPFYFALHQTLKLLTYIDKNKAFSELSVNSLKNIKYCAITITAMIIVSLPFLYMMAEIDDAPGIFAFGLVITFTSIVIAVFAAVLQKLLTEAMNIKSDNDLTI